MKTYNYIYQNNQFQNEIDYSLFKNKKNILIQIFCGQNISTLEYITNLLNKHLPQAICIGSTTDGEIKDNNVSTLGTMVAISVFENTTLKISIKNSENSFENGYEIAKDIITDNTKLIITFTDSTSTNGEDYLKGISSFNNSIMVCGGMAGDNGKFSKTYISAGKTIIDKGAVAVSLNSDILQVKNDIKHGWSPIGIEHTIDKIEGNRIYRISGMKAIDFYKKYLGNGNLHTFTEFPLMIKKAGISIARAAVTRYPDGSLGCGGGLREGDKVRLGIADAELIINTPFKYLEDIDSHPTESFFIYSCMARRRYMQKLTLLEIEPFTSIATTSGFFTNAEFFHENNKNELMNQTITLVGLSENPQSVEKPILSNNISNTQDISYAKTIQALTSLIQQSAKDQNEQAIALQKQIEYSETLLKNQKLFLKHSVHETNTPLSVIMSNIDLHEMEFGKNKYLENIEVAIKNLFSIYDDLSYLVKKDQVEYKVYTIDLIDFVRSRVNFFRNVAANMTNSRFLFRSNKVKVFIDFSESKLQRIIDNTLTNAIKYSYEGEIIKVDLESEGECIRFSVSSKSRRIQNPKKIFEEYYREEHSKDGFGLGLNLVKRICEEEGVLIKVNSNIEQTTFSYSFKGCK
ncbi:diguanylate cyclase [Halarcobacter mediterraneus]|uniref:histidine kinase n=1 Tax=Halarcobacter mediterraneus TaxID=2023153 RepID=A0A4V1M1C4_9BACT|nr:FIST N-terminal domain-containing protein [Halarcobacter mediterraneus]RXK13174.1 diguanylate cyclase [Halarcobacter mediterraneus]